MTFQNKMNSSPVVSSAKISPFKSSLSPTSKKQSNSLQVNLFSKLVSNGKLTSEECKKYLEYNLCLYCGVEDYKLDSYPKKQTMVTSKGYSTSATASRKPLEK